MTFWSPELCCPVCQDYFRDPVLLPCSHSFCNKCLQGWFSSRKIRDCPLCKTVSPSKVQPTRNLVLKNLCEEFRRNVDPNSVCRRHAEYVKFYCEDHGTPICIVCKYSDEHTNHRIVPLEEVADLARAGVQPNLEALQVKLKRFHEAKAHWEEAGQHLKRQTQETVDTLRDEFINLRCFLAAEEELRVSRINKEKEQKMKVLENQLAALTPEINAMESTLITMKEHLSSGNASLLLSVDELRKTAQRPLPDDPELASGGEIDVATHLRDLKFQVWYKMKNVVSKTPVAPNPNTSHGDIHTSEELTSVRYLPPRVPFFCFSLRGSPVTENAAAPQHPSP